LISRARKHATKHKQLVSSDHLLLFKRLQILPQIFTESLFDVFEDGEHLHSVGLQSFNFTV